MNALDNNFCKKKKILTFTIAIILFLIISIGFPSHGNISIDYHSDNESFLSSESHFTDQLKISSFEGDNLEIIDSLLNSKLQNFSDLGYFPQRYRPSLQALYYAINSLDVIGHLDTINSSFIVNRVMSFYDNDTAMFIDEYALLYLDTDIELIYYPLSSVLQVNCYALLTLDLLNETDLIDTQGFVNFIWSCFDSNTGGFIGQPYSEDLDDFFKIPTADNTYFAIHTLDVLGISWINYNPELDLIVSFLDSLQIKDQYNPSYGGFLNDPSYELDTMWFFEPNIHSSYYAIKTLDIIGLADVIDLASFREYLDKLYQDQETYFMNAYWGGTYPRNFTNIASTAMGIELSQIVDWVGCDTNEAFNFVKTHRNALGIWDTSTEEGSYELIDTYQILRSLNGTSFMEQFSLQDLESIDYGITLFEQYDGYALFSKEYTSINTIYSICRTAKLFNRITDLEIGSIYDQILPSYFEYAKTFRSHAHYKSPIENFHSFPIEYCTQGHRDLLGETGVRFGHEATFKALTVLRDLYKLDDFEISNNLSKIIEEVINSQFLGEPYSNFGGFKPDCFTSNPDIANKKVLLKHSYYALKTLEFLCEYLELGNLTDLDFDRDALFTYVFGNIIDTPEELYYNPEYLSTTIDRLENTYYMTYVLKAINMYELDTSKIETFVNNSLDYENVKSLYYCFKLKQLLNLSIEFEIPKTQCLVKKIYESTLGECFSASQKQDLNQEILLWLSEMAIEDEMRIFHENTNPITLGHSFSLNVSLSNIILSTFGPYMSAKFESETIGTVSLESTSDGRYSGIINAPLDKSNYPNFSGIIQVYYKNEVKNQKDILVNSEYIRNDLYSITKEGKEIDFYVNSSLKRESDTVKLFDSNVYCKIYKNGTYVDTINFDILETQAYTEFKRSYNLTESGNYTFSVYLEDGFSEGTYHLFDDSYEYDDGSNSDPDPQDPDPDPTPEDDPPQDPDDTDDPDGNEDNGGTDDNETGDNNEGENDDDNNSQGDSTQKEEYFIHLPSLLIPMMTVSSVLFLTTSIYRKRNEKHLT